MLKSKPPNSAIDKVTKDRQLLVRSIIELSNGTAQKINALVDTGAEANLIREGLIPRECISPAETPLHFQTANRDTLAGGNEVAKVKLKLQLERNEMNQAEVMDFEVEFYEAKIQCDAILSFPLLSKEKLGIFPHHKALVKDSADLEFLLDCVTGEKNHKMLFTQSPTWLLTTSQRFQK